MEQLIEDTQKLKLSEEEVLPNIVEEPKKERPKRATKAPVLYSEEQHVRPKRVTNPPRTYDDEEPAEIVSKKRATKKEKPKPKPKPEPKPEPKSKSKTQKTKPRPVSLPNEKKTTLKNHKKVKSLPDYIKPPVKKEETVVEVVKTLESPDFLKIKDDLKEGMRPWLTANIQDIIFNSLAGTSEPVKKGSPELLVLVGPPASGKSTVKKQLNFTNAVNLDVDEIQIETQKIYGNKNTFKIMKDYPTLIQFITKKAIYGNYNMILDTTGKMKAPIKYVIQKAKEAGYKITMAFIYTTVEKCIQNIENRNKTNMERQPIPVSVVKKTYREFKESGIVNYYLIHSPELMKKIDHIYLFDNSQAPNPAQIVFEKHSDMRPKVNIAFPDFYNVKVSFNEPYFSKVK